MWALHLAQCNVLLCVLQTLPDAALSFLTRASFKITVNGPSGTFALTLAEAHNSATGSGLCINFQARCFVNCRICVGDDKKFLACKSLSSCFCLQRGCLGG